MADRFQKMHGLGNDFVVIDAREHSVEMSAARIRAIGDRRTGIGFDQLILIEPSDVADVKMRFFNADGSEAGACGNGTRAAAMLLGGAQTIETLGGILSSEASAHGASVNMGHPRFEWDAIPLGYAMDTTDMPVGWDGLDRPMAVNVGNPHVIFFVDDLAKVDLAAIGPVIEYDPLFPERVNVNVAQITGQSSLSLRVWERGAGETRACGTGACATAVAAIQRGLVTGPVAVLLPGGTLQIDWQKGEPIQMSGPATHVYTGETDWSLFG
jgi:diaminopimelate epimerase